MGWLSGWQYRKKVTISGSSGAGENYQVKLSIGSSSGGDFHLEGHCTDFPNDIRFTDDDGETLLDYWIEDPTQDPITVWVEVKDSLDSDVDIFVYYNNPSASSASDGSAVFDFFDDFNDLDKWTVTGTPTPYASGGVLVFLSDTSDRYVSTPLSFFDDYVWEIEIQKQGDGTTYAAQSFKWWSGGAEIYRVIWHANNTIAITEWSSREDFISGTRVEDTVWHTIKVTRTSNGDWALYFDDELVGTANEVTSTSTDEFGIGSAEDIDAYYDKVRIRKYASPEPSFSSAGSEELPYFTCIDISSLTSSPLPFQELHTLCSEILKTSGFSSSLLSVLLNSQDNFGLLDANLSGLLLIANSVDTIDTSDGCTITFSFTGNCLDVLHSTDNASSLLSMLCQSTDKFGGTDSEFSQLSLLTTLLDKLHQLDSSASNITLERTILDSLALQDLSSFPIGIIVSASDVLHVYDLNSVRLTFSCSSIDIIKNKDTAGVNVTFHLSTDDILKGADFVSGHLQAILNTLDSLKITDSSLSSIFAGILVSASDVLATSDYNAIRLEFLESSIDIVKSKDSSSSIVSFQLNSTDVLHGIDVLTANLQAILGAISKFKNSDGTSSYEVIIGIPVKIFKAQEKVLVFRAKKKPFRFRVG